MRASANLLRQMPGPNGSPTNGPLRTELVSSPQRTMSHSGLIRTLPDRGGSGLRRRGADAGGSATRSEIPNGDAGKHQTPGGAGSTNLAISLARASAMQSDGSGFPWSMSWSRYAQQRGAGHADGRAVNPVQCLAMTSAVGAGSARSSLPAKRVDTVPGPCWRRNCGRTCLQSRLARPALLPRHPRSATPAPGESCRSA